MSELATYQGNLPDTMEDLAQFLLIAPEKASALRAEIRAIQKVGLAKAVYDQKLDEQRRLCDMILDASVRLGEMTKAIPTVNSNQHIAKAQTDSAVVLQKTKTEQVVDLGFSPKQVERFETLADNKDLVEQEKSVAKEENRMPTRTNVIDMAKARKDRFDRNVNQMDQDAKTAKAFVHATHAPLTIGTPDEVAGAVWRNAGGVVQSDIDDIGYAIAALEDIRNKLMNGVKNYGKT